MVDGTIMKRRLFFKRAAGLTLCALPGIAARGAPSSAVVGVIAPEARLVNLGKRLKLLSLRSTEWRFIGFPRDARPFPEQALQVIREHGARVVIGMPQAECPELIGMAGPDETCRVTVCSTPWQESLSWLLAERAPLTWGCSLSIGNPSVQSQYASSLAGWLMLVGPNRDIQRVDYAGNVPSGGVVGGLLLSDNGEIRFSVYPPGSMLTRPVIVIRTGSRGEKRFCSDHVTGTADGNKPKGVTRFADRPLLDLLQAISRGQSSPGEPERWIPWERFVKTASQCGLPL
ncbi:MAG: hypothetical protein KBH78_05335 [Candidatus Hydrogenedentes bacterium]|nr:hypothetical protein [Candidatus Hydrogenedentota bacterium]